MKSTVYTIGSKTNAGLPEETFRGHLLHNHSWQPGRVRLRERRDNSISTWSLKTGLKPMARSKKTK